jgi:hypothetical protein
MLALQGLSSLPDSREVREEAKPAKGGEELSAFGELLPQFEALLTPGKVDKLQNAENRSLRRKRCVTKMESFGR